VPYLVFLAKNPARATHARRAQAPGHLGEGAVWKSATLILPAVALIVLGSIGMVRSALALADHWGLPKALVGVLLLAVLTSLPNAFTAVRLGVSGRGAALVSETVNSNTINLVGGVLFPALVVGIGQLSGADRFGLAWLIGMTCVSLVVLGRPGGARRLDGVLLIALYLVFVGVQVAYR
jgi:cation:H+ antiporter